jgi:hypothetical protein
LGRASFSFAVWWACCLAVGFGGAAGGWVRGHCLKLPETAALARDWFLKRGELRSVVRLLFRRYAFTANAFSADLFVACLHRIEFFVTQFLNVEHLVACRSRCVD